MREQSLEPFHNPTLRALILLAQSDAEQTIHTEAIDEVIFAGASPEATEKARNTIQSFKQFIEDNKDEITALQLLYSRRKGQCPTFDQLKELARTVEMPPRSWTTEKLWQAYETLETSKVKGHTRGAVTDLVSLIRFTLEQETILTPFAETVEDRFQRWLTEQGPNRFTAEQLKWLRMIKDHVASSVSIELADLDYTPFAQQGGLGKAHELFQGELDSILKRLNGALIA